MHLKRLLALSVICSHAFLFLNAGVQLLWDPPTVGVPLGYNVYRSLTSVSGFTRLNAQIVTQCSYVDESALPGTTYYYTVKGVSQCGTEGQASALLTVSVPAAVNNSPDADAGADQTVKGGQAVTLSGSGLDPDGDPLTFAWQQVSGPGVLLPDAHRASISFTAPALDSSTAALFRLTVSDSRGGSGTDDVSITFAPKNRKPTAKAGTAKTVASGETVTLQGEGSDPDGDPISFVWSQVSGPEVATSSVGRASIRFSAPKSQETVRLTFELRVVDVYGATGKDQVDVTIGGGDVSKWLVGPARIPQTDEVFHGAYVAAAVVNRSQLPRDPMISLIGASGDETGRLKLGPGEAAIVRLKNAGVKVVGGRVVEELGATQEVVGVRRVENDHHLRKVVDKVGRAGDPAAVADLDVVGDGLGTEVKPVLSQGLFPGSARRVAGREGDEGDAAEIRAGGRRGPRRGTVDRHDAWLLGGHLRSCRRGQGQEGQDED